MNRTETEAILSAIQSYRAYSRSYEDNFIASDRVAAIKFYRGDKSILPFRQNRVSFISRDVSDVIEAAMPDLMEVFFGNRELGKFTPIIKSSDLLPTQEEAIQLIKGEITPEKLKDDKIKGLEKIAEEATQYCDYIIKKLNPGFRIFYDCIKDSLLVKNGFAKIYWCEEDEYSDETYKDLTDEQYQQLILQEDVESVIQDDDNKTTKARKKNKKKYVKIESVLPEYIYTDPFAPSIQESRYFEEVMFRTRNELIASGYDEKMVNMLPTSGQESSLNQVAMERYRNQNPQFSGVGIQSGSSSSASNLIQISQVYITYPSAESGIDKLLKVTTANDSEQILIKDGEPDIEEVDCIPYETCTAIFEPHQLIGNAIADYIKDVQLIKSTLQRQALDNQLMVNNQILYIDTNSEVDPEYVLNAGPGGVITGRGPGGVTPIPIQPMGPESLNLIQYFDTVRDERTGVTKYNQGLDADTLNNTATGTSLLLDRSDRRQKLIARSIAETFVKGLFTQVLKLAIKHSTESQIFKFGDSWKVINPSNWSDKLNFNISIGSGNMDQAQELQTLIAAKTIQDQSIPYGIVSAENVYNLNKKLFDTAGILGVEQYFMKPQPNQPIQPPAPAQDPAVDLQIKTNELNARNEEIRLKTEAAKLQLDQAKSAANLELEYAKLDQARKIKEAEFGLKIAETTTENKFKKAEFIKDLMSEIIGEQNVQQQ